jgi:hypothetical protein
MKKETCFFILTLVVLLCNHYNAAAQCNQSGNSYSCSAVSPSVYYPYDTFNEWVTGSDYLNVTVYMEAYEENDPTYEPYLYTDIWTDTFTWSGSLYGGSYGESFSATAQINGLIGLYTYARCGEAHISATW